MRCWHPAGWKLFADPQGYFSNWLVGLSTFTGSALGIMLVDYFAVHRQRLVPTHDFVN